MMQLWLQGKPGQNGEFKSRLREKTPLLGEVQLSAADLSQESEMNVVELRVTSVHVDGRIYHWRVLANTNFTIADLLRAIVVRSKATDSPLRADCVVLAELMCSRLHRIHAPNSKIAKLRADDTFVLYEVPMIGNDGALEPSIPVHARPGGRELRTIGSLGHGMGEYLTVAFHPRRSVGAQESAHFFPVDGEVAACELISIPMLLHLRTGVSEQQLYDIVYARLYGTAEYMLNGEEQNGQPAAQDLKRNFRKVATRKETLLDSMETFCRMQTVEEKRMHCPFELVFCEHARLLTEGGMKLDQASHEEAYLGKPHGPVKLSEKERFSLCAIEWEVDAPPAPWVEQQIVDRYSVAPDTFLECVIGVDVGDLVEQMRAMRKERKELLQELAELRHWSGKHATASKVAEWHCTEMWNFSNHDHAAASPSPPVSMGPYTPLTLSPVSRQDSPRGGGMVPIAPAPRNRIAGKRPNSARAREHTRNETPVRSSTSMGHSGAISVHSPSPAPMSWNTFMNKGGLRPDSTDCSTRAATAMSYGR
eukprot:gnl/TRDRNA2_/TRDRNA2_188203_c0_seq1.p1 gnl/TRDRNA2_/TRDRNA2_188203_c0~~gnl/TRDRNA2_/TRDRNA2_188203_c0_seq1.p1  ORF type:complete len:535 (+),score=71.70 gnl/TRDRNA2_/TRDRNA2_188203_c0_seq1:150-1754(+)